MITGQDVINALNNCNDNCKNCVASHNGSSCKEYQSLIEKWQDERHKEIHKVLSNGVRK